VKSRLALELRIGPRTLEMARELLAGVASCCRPGEPLLLESDEHRPYRQAMLDIFGMTCHRRRKRGRGRRKYPDSKPAPGLMIGFVHKERDSSGRILSMKPRRYCGRLKDIKQCLAAHGAGRHINTGHIERLNGTLRTQQARLARRTRNRTVKVENLQSALWLWRDLYNWTRIHGTLQHRTPATASGLATQTWTVAEYVRRPVHVSPLQRGIWREQHEKLLTVGLYNQKHRQPLPVT
jgi:hypothetical protein